MRAGHAACIFAGMGEGYQTDRPNEHLAQSVLPQGAKFMGSELAA